MVPVHLHRAVCIHGGNVPSSRVSFRLAGRHVVEIHARGTFAGSGPCPSVLLRRDAVGACAESIHEGYRRYGLAAAKEHAAGEVTKAFLVGTGLSIDLS